MRLYLRHGAVLVRSLLRFSWHAGNWWVPIAIVAFLIVALGALSAQAVVGPTLYVLF